MVAAEPGHGRGGDVSAETIRRRHPYDAGDGVRGVPGLFEGAHGTLDLLGHPHGLGTELGEFPAAGGAREHAAAQRLLQRRDPPGDGGVVQPERLGRRRKFRRTGHREQDQQVIGIGVHICNSAHTACRFGH